jgi:hypothetical protein
MGVECSIHDSLKPGGRSRLRIACIDNAEISSIL